MNSIQRFFVVAVAAGLFLALSMLSFWYVDSKRAGESADSVSIRSSESMVLQGEDKELQAEKVDVVDVRDESQAVQEAKALAQEKSEAGTKLEIVDVQQSKSEKKPSNIAVKEVNKQVAAVKPAVKVASRGTSSIASNKVNGIVSTARQYIGKPYEYGASGPESFDCSGLTMYVFGKFGVSLPHSANAQSKLGQYVSRDKLQAGDLVFFTTNGSGGVSHVGIYTGGGSFIHAPETGKTVGIQSMSSSYYSSRYITARRIN